MDILKLGTDLLNQQLGANIDENTLSTALSGLLGDGQGNVDLAGLVSKMGQSGELGALVNSWLGDGPNEAITADSVTNLLGENSVNNFANSLGTDGGSAAETLAQVLPQMMDKASSGGSLLDSVGGLDGLLGAAKSFLS